MQLQSVKRICYADVWDHFTKQTQQSARRLQLHEYWVKHFINWLLSRGIRRYYGITPAIQREYVALLMSKPGMTQRDRINGIRKVFEMSNIYIFDFNRIKIKIPRRQSIPHDIFTDEDLRLIRENATGYIRDIYMVGLYTGLRKKDICLMQKGNVHLDTWQIALKMHKTQKEVEIPILYPLRDYLSEAISKSQSEYVFPELAQMYQEKPYKITHNFIYFLRKIGIKDIRQRDSSRKLSANRKGIHSLRHTFAYICGKSGIPPLMLQATMGHASPKMTEHYMRHATEEDKRRCLEKINNTFR